jgi:hypothetical protein
VCWWTRSLTRCSSLASDNPPWLVGQALLAIEMVLTVLTPSTSAKAAPSIPILVPGAQFNGVTGQTIVPAFLLATDYEHTVANVRRATHLPRDRAGGLQHLGALHPSVMGRVGGHLFGCHRARGRPGIWMTAADQNVTS